MGSSQTRGCRFPGANPLVARVAGDPLSLQIGDGGTASHSDQMAVAPVPISGLAGRRRYSNLWGTYPNYAISLRIKADTAISLGDVALMFASTPLQSTLAEECERLVAPRAAQAGV